MPRWQVLPTLQYAGMSTANASHGWLRSPRCPVPSGSNRRSSSDTLKSICFASTPPHRVKSEMKEADPAQVANRLRGRCGFQVQRPGLQPRPYFLLRQSRTPPARGSSPLQFQSIKYGHLPAMLGRLTAAREHSVRVHIAHGSLAGKLDGCPTGFGRSALAFGDVLQGREGAVCARPRGVYLRCPRSESSTGKGAGFALDCFYPWRTARYRPVSFFHIRSRMGGFCGPSVSFGRSRGIPPAVSE